MQILGKCSLLESQIMDRVRKGATQVELNLSRELMMEDGSITELENAYDLSLLDRVHVRSVHIPIFVENIEDFMNNKYKKLFTETCRLAQLAYDANKDGQKVIVVVHFETDFNKLVITGLAERAKETVLEQVEKYDGIEIGIENVSPILIKEGRPVFRCGIIDDNIKLCEYIDHERVGTVLDVCHAMISRDYLRVIKTKQKEIELPEMSRYFQINKKWIKLIHLATYKGSGYGKGYHGIGFEEKNETLEEIVQLYIKEGYKVPVTLEVYEKDYDNSKYYASTRRALIECLNERCATYTI